MLYKSNEVISQIGTRATKNTTFRKIKQIRQTEDIIQESQSAIYESQLGK
jgi:hypothetical protein